MRINSIVLILLIMMTSPFLLHADSEFVFPDPDPSKSANEQMQVFNIPDDILPQMSSEDLVRVILRWPYVPLALISFNTDEQKINFMWKKFNGVRELLSRVDTGSALLDAYEKTDMMQMASKSVEQLSDDSIKNQLRHELIELLLLYPVVFDKLMPEETARFKAVAIEKFKMERQNAFRMSRTPMENTAKVLLRFVLDENPPGKIDLTKKKDVDWLLNQVSKNGGEPK